MVNKKVTQNRYVQHHFFCDNALRFAYAIFTHSIKSEHKKHIAVLVGSLSKHSLNRKIADFLAENAPENIELPQIDIGKLPFYDRDSDENPPPEYTALLRQIAQADGTILITSEHNSSTPAVLKNAIARQVGDESASQFSKEYKRYFGCPCPPSEGEGVGD